MVPCWLNLLAVLWTLWESHLLCTGQCIPRGTLAPSTWEVCQGKLLGGEWCWPLRSSGARPWRRSQFATGAGPWGRCCTVCLSTLPIPSLPHFLLLSLPPKELRCDMPWNLSSPCDACTSIVRVFPCTLLPQRIPEKVLCTELYFQFPRHGWSERLGQGL